VHCWCITAYLNHLKGICASAATVKGKIHRTQTQALMNAVVEQNAPLFNPAKALEAEREVMHCAEVARLQFKDLGPADSIKQAAQLHSYQQAISDLNRSRLVFKPCKANAKVPLVR
jgi:hypothetical protein